MIAVSDPSADRAAASMDVSVGSFSDPEQIPGEHQLLPFPTSVSTSHNLIAFVLLNCSPYPILAPSLHPFHRLVWLSPFLPLSHRSRSWAGSYSLPSLLSPPLCTSLYLYLCFSISLALCLAPYSLNITLILSTSCCSRSRSLRWPVFTLFNSTTTDPASLHIVPSLLRATAPASTARHH